MQAFATAADLGAYLPVGAEVDADDVDRILLRASEVVAEAATGGFLLGTDGLPAFETEREALTQATCAQVEQWLEVGEENDVAGYSRAASISTQGLNVSSLPSTLAPRARRILRSANLTGGRAW